MSVLLPILASCTLTLAVDPDKPVPMRYLRLNAAQPTAECEIAISSSDSGIQYTSCSERGREKTTLTLRFDRSGQLTAAEVVQEGVGKRTAALTFPGKGLSLLKRDGTTDFLNDLLPNPVVMTLADWSAVFQLVRRYDASTAGRQEFQGVFIHPVQPLRKILFQIERLGTDTVTVKEKDKDQEVKLDRFRVSWTAGDHLVWADTSGRVVKIVPPGSGALPVVLQGFEAAWPR
jgi:hypothetical protein